MQGSKKKPSNRPEQADFELEQVTIPGTCLTGKRSTKIFCQLNGNICFSIDVSNRLLATQLLKTVFQLKDENQFPISGFFIPFRETFAVMLF